MNLFNNAADLSGYLFRITDNGGATADRYTVAFSDGDCLCLSGSPSHPQGISMCSEFDPQVPADAVENGTEVDLAWGDLPEHIRAHVLARINEGWRDFLEAANAAETRDAAEQNEGLPDSGGVGIYRDGDFYVRRDGARSDDLGPYPTYREALLASLPSEYSLSGPEYHSTAMGNGGLNTNDSHPEIQAAIAALEARVEAENNFRRI